MTTVAEVYTNARTRVQDVRVRATVARAGSGQAGEIDSLVLQSEPGRLRHLTRPDLTDLEPGDYVLTVEARAGRQVASRQVAFTVAPE